MSRLRVVGLRFRGFGPFDLAVEAGGCLGLFGPSGAGKSLMLRAIADLDPHEGEVFLDDTPASTLEGPAWRRRVGLLPAESRWWTDRVGAQFPAGGRDWLDPLGLPADALDWEIRRLSTGERQRFALARLLGNRPEALLLDEPTSSLDPENVERMERVLHGYREETGAALVWVSHDRGQLERVADTRRLVRDGRLHDLEAAMG
ncbi:MAG: ATP-binding cassette domain-containing protein [Candidatus Eisenbacteria bacterium]|nr:ATP-binding cassette domain-containing protein [Candidatus Latescibacterota bacterium]MBD3301515.1 ATP-binding cassette domain-containing protein [Candidatus Eisenbacteria bacterium]